MKSHALLIWILTGMLSTSAAMNGYQWWTARGEAPGTPTSPELLPATAPETPSSPILESLCLTNEQMQALVTRYGT